MANLVLMMGAPGSGKTTYVKSILKPEDTYISRDEIRYSMVAENEDYFSKENDVMKEFIRQVDTALVESKGDVYADATHLNPKSRAKLLKNLKNKAENIIVIYIKKDLVDILHQNANRTGRERVPENSVIKMYHSIVMPMDYEGINKVLVVENGKLSKEIRLK